MSQCQSKTNKGTPCRAPATVGGLCFFHANPKEARELGRIGGRQNRGKQTQDLSPTQTMTIAQVNEGLANTIRGVHSKRISARAGSALAQLYAVLLRAIPVADHDARITRLEELTAEQATADALDTGPGVNPPSGRATQAGPEIREADRNSPCGRADEQVLEQSVAAASAGELPADPHNGSAAPEGTEPDQPRVSQLEEVEERPVAASDPGTEGSR
ncbi:MAG TPA: hypothetical protein VFI95_21960 [Terriglobales bacterium]|nr:hypothetical protein [Terriglobales bacterium]